MDFRSQPVAAKLVTEEPPVPARPLAGSRLARIERDRLLRVCYVKDILPFAFVNEESRLVGFDVEMAHILARELPVLLAPEEEGEGPVGFVAGAIDLLYRDPESGELVVADYKSDAVSSPSEARRKADDYRGQGERYVRAVQQALELPRPPRFELWFLAIGHVESLPSFSA